MALARCTRLPLAWGAPALATRGLKDWREGLGDPAQTAAASRAGPRGVPDESDDGVEREVKWGKNVPASAGQWKEELKYVRGAGRVAAGLGQWVQHPPGWEGRAVELAAP